MFNQLKQKLHGGWPAGKTPDDLQHSIPLASENISGLYHFSYQSEGERSRIHLRVDADGRGILLVNASRVLHLNPTATFMAYLALTESPRPAALRAIRRRYQVSATQADQDYAQLVSQLAELMRPDGACPIHELELDVTAPFSNKPSAPYRMDLALTYRCNNDCPHCYNARPRSYTELNTDAWKAILDSLWAVGIPHVVFTGGESTLRQDLPDLISHAERNGQITGVNTNGRRMSDPDYVRQLTEAGLDHVQITLESHDPAIHDRMVSAPGAWKQTVAGIKNALGSSLFVMTNTTLLRENSSYLGETLHYLSSLGVPTIGLNALIYSGRGATVGSAVQDNELPGLLEQARSHAAWSGQRLIWYTPTQYCRFDPVQLDLGVKGCSAALYNLCVEPDGAVLPCQSYYRPVGNMLTDTWESIWNHELCVLLRERRYVEEKCTDCALLPECGGGCPLQILEKNPLLSVQLPDPFVPGKDQRGGSL